MQEGCAGREEGRQGKEGVWSDYSFEKLPDGDGGKGGHDTTRDVGVFG